jgi:hypothetical protein
MFDGSPSSYKNWRPREAAIHIQFCLLWCYELWYLVTHTHRKRRTAEKNNTQGSVTAEYISHSDRPFTMHKCCRTKIKFGYVRTTNVWAGYSDWLQAGRSGDRIPVGARFFRTCPDRPWGPPSLLYNGYRVFPGGRKRPGRHADPSLLSSAEV